MHTVKIELKKGEEDIMEEKLWEAAEELGQPLNFSLMVMAPDVKKPSLLTGYFKDKAESLKQLKLLGLEKRAVHGYLKAKDWEDSVKEHFKPFGYRNVIWAPDWSKDHELAPLVKKQKAALKKKAKASRQSRPPAPSAKQSLDGQQGAAQRNTAAYKSIREDSALSSNKAGRQNLRDETEVVVIKQQMGMAFGTGNHPTTKLCLRRCVEAVPEYDRPTVLDIGCGSGVLAITAMALGAKKAIGFDIDEHSIVVAKANAKLNASKAKFHVGDLYKDELPVCDIVFANLLANLISDNVKKLWECVSPGGVLILSGLLKEELPKIAKLFKTDAIPYTLGQWGALALIKEEA